MIKLVIRTLLALALLFNVCSAGEKPEISDQQDKVNYTLGFVTGRDFGGQSFEINPDTFGF